MNTTEAAKDAIWLMKLLDGFNIIQPLPIPIYCDNQFSILMSHDQKFHTKTKHVRTRHHSILQQVENGKIQLVYLCQHSPKAKSMAKEHLNSLIYIEKILYINLEDVDDIFLHFGDVKQ